MKTSVAIASILLISFISNTQAQRRPARSQGVPSSLSLDQQAEQLAQAYWKKRVVRCADSYYNWGPIAINGPYGLIEMKNIIIQTSGAPPASPSTKADILNERERPSGLQWSGQSVLSQEVYRYMPSGSRAWGLWANGGREVINIERRNGRWIVPTDVRPITCQAVNAFTLKPGAVPTVGNPPTIDNNGILVFPGRYPRWFSVGNGPFTLLMGNPYPSIQIDRSNFGVSPSYGQTGASNRKALAAKLPLGAFVAKIGVNGQPFMPFAEYKYFSNTNIFPDYRFDTSEEVFVGINDFDYSDNRGAYRFQIIDRAGITGARLISTENCYGEHCQTWQVSLVKSDGWYDTGIPVVANDRVDVACGDDHCTDVQSGIFSLSVGDVTLENEEGRRKSLSFATKEYIDWKDMHGRGGRVDYIVAPGWRATLKVKINGSFPKTHIKNLVVTVKPAGT